MYVCLSVCVCVCLCRLVFPLESGIMCLDIHEQLPSLVAVGLYDGTCVCVCMCVCVHTYTDCTLYAFVQCYSVLCKLCYM